MNQHPIPDLLTEYVPAAVYLDEADSVEYVRRDVACVYRRVDGILTLVLDMKTRKLNGFRPDVAGGSPGEGARLARPDPQGP
jgi:hypothetical protein